MNGFSVQVDREDVQPLLRGLEEKLPYIYLKNAEFYLHEIPPQQKPEEAHVRRLEVLKRLRSKEIRRFLSFLKRQKALPIIKIKTDVASYVVKPTHSMISEKLFDRSQENIRFEAYVSELTSQLAIGPDFHGKIYYNPRMLFMIEECISRDNKWDPMYTYAGRLDLYLFPVLLGEMLGKLHKSRHWKTDDGHEFRGRLWYHDRVLLHLFQNTKTGYLCLVDYGNAELITPERFKKDNIPKSRLLWELKGVISDLIDYAFPHKRKITRKNVSEFKGVINGFSEAYSKESGIHVKPSYLMGLIRSKS